MPAGSAMGKAAERLGKAGGSGEKAAQQGCSPIREAGPWPEPRLGQDVCGPQLLDSPLLSPTWLTLMSS